MSVDLERLDGGEGVGEETGSVVPSATTVFDNLVTGSSGGP